MFKCIKGSYRGRKSKLENDSGRSNMAEVIEILFSSLFSSFFFTFGYYVCSMLVLQ